MLFTPWPIVLLVLVAIVFVIVIFVLLGITIVRSNGVKRGRTDHDDLPRL